MLVPIIVIITSIREIIATEILYPEIKISKLSLISLRLTVKQIRYKGPASKTIPKISQAIHPFFEQPS